jgi:hypothetical protein
MAPAPVAYTFSVLSQPGSAIPQSAAGVITSPPPTVFDSRSHVRIEVPAMARSQRRQTFVDANVQGALARRIIIHWLFFVCVCWGVPMFVQLVLTPSRPVGETLRLIWATQGPLMLAMAFLLPVFVIDTIKLSHRFTGPILNLRRALQDVADGQPPRKLHVRKNDFWQDLASDYNVLAARLNGGNELSDTIAERETAVSASK